LDIDSRGLLVFTQDGTIAKLLIGSGIEKEYLVKVEGGLDDKKLNLLRYGLELEDYKLLPAIVTQKDAHTLNMILKEGKHRQIRKMCEQVGLRVTYLQRIRIGSILLGNLKEGQWRFLNPGESFK